MSVETDVAAALDIPDLSDPASFAEDVPHPAFADIRERPGLYWQPTEISSHRGGYWAVTRFADIVAVEKDPATFTSTNGAAFPGMNPPDGVPLLDNIMFTDPPRHTRLRRAAAKGFAPRVVANFEGWIREIVQEAIAGVRDLDSFDYVEMFARTVPAQVIARILGVPPEDRQRLVDWTIAAFEESSNTEGLSEGEGVADRSVDLHMEIAAYANTMQRYKREHPADDMFTMVGALVDDGTITQGEFEQWMFLIMVAGFETTHTAIGHSMRMYLSDPVVRERMDRAVQEGLTLRAVDEFVRLISPPMEMARTATRDTEVAGQQVLKDDILVMYFISANRDAEVFTRPDEFDPWRSETETLAYGSGVHRCLGSHLARLELKILWEELLAADLKLRLDGEPRRGWSPFINQLTALPVAKG